MMLKTLFYSSLALFSAGFIYKLHTWFSRNVGFEARDIGYSDRIFSAAAGIFRTLFSLKIFILIKAFFVCHHLRR